VPPDLIRRNLAFGWALFALFLALSGGVVAVAFVYMTLD
jgi:hypothetical protein